MPLLRLNLRPLLVLVLLSAAVLPALPAMAATASERPRIGLVLGGGGARGLAHIGVLKVLEEARIPIDCVVGTSMGSLVAGGYAVGRTPDELERLVVAAPWDKLLAPYQNRAASSYQNKRQSDLNIALEVGLNNKTVQLPSNAISTQEVEFFLRDMTNAASVTSFDQLTIPYRAIATNLATGEMIVMRDGDLVTAMLGSMAVPGIFPAVNDRGRLLADGGLVRNVPVDIARDLCADVVIAVNVSSPLLEPAELTDVVNIADQYTRLMMNQNVKPQLDSLTDKDVLLEPGLGKLSSMDFDKAAELISLGEAAAREALPRLRRYSLNEDRYAAWYTKRLNIKPVSQNIASVAIAPMRTVNPESVRKEILVPVDAPLDREALEQSLRELYGTGDFSQVNYQLLPGEFGQQLMIHPIEKSWGPNYLALGLNYGSDFDGWSAYELSTQYRRTWLNSLGAEWRLLGQFGTDVNVYSEFYQPLSIDRGWFVAPFIGYRNDDQDLWLGETKYSTYTNRTLLAGLDIGTSLLNRGEEFRFGPVFHENQSRSTVGLPLISELSSHDYGLQAELYYDQLDDYFFPTKGSMIHLNAYHALGGGGDYGDYSYISGSWRFAFSNGPLQAELLLDARWGEGLLPINQLAYLGGFRNLSSYHSQQLFGTKKLLAGLNLRHPLKSGQLGLLLETGMIRGIEALVPDKVRYSGMLYWGNKTFLGPVYLGLAYGDNKDMRAYLILGQPR